MKKVLIALDYDPTAQKVAKEGFSLAKDMNAEVVLLHVIKEPVYYSSPDYSPIMGFTGYTDMSPLELNSTETLKLASEHYLEKMKQHLGDESIKIFVREGDYDKAILKVAKEIHAHIIVMGSHSRKWLEEILIGSVTEKVLRKTLLPIFIVPTKGKK
nr:universal stress protein [uncultured Carboxylicivirga sp.]